MIQKLTPLFGKHVDSMEFKAMMAELFPDFKKFDKNKEYKDKASKITLRVDALTSYDDDAPVSNDPNDYKYFTAFFLKKDNPEMPFGISVKDDEAAVLKKAGKPTHHNKVTTGGSFLLVNDMHYHIDNYKMVVSFDPSTGKNYGEICFNLRLKGMKF
jgi:hypothetical protein